MPIFSGAMRKVVELVDNIQAFLYNNINIVWRLVQFIINLPVYILCHWQKTFLAACIKIR